MTIPLPTWLWPAVMPKVVLALNHVISSEDAAMARLRAHAGRHLRFECQGPAGLPALPAVVLLITPAGLLDLPETPHAEAPSVDLDILVDASNPLAVALGGLRGERPRMAVSGDAALAGDVHWLIENLRWDIEDDLSRLIEPALAHQVVRWGSWWISGLREGVARVMVLAGRWAPGRSSA